MLHRPFYFHSIRTESFWRHGILLARHSVCPFLGAENCTGFCTDCLHPGSTAGYWPFLGGSLDVIEAKGKSCSIRSL